MGTPATAACDANVFSQIISGNLIVCSKTFQDYETSSGQEQIQNVADNAQAQADAGVIDQSSADVSQSFADTAESQVTQDVADVTDEISSSTVGLIFTICPNGNSGLQVPGLPCIEWNYFIYGALALLILYIVAVASSFAPRPE